MQLKVQEETLSINTKLSLFSIIIVYTLTAIFTTLKVVLNLLPSSIEFNNEITEGGILVVAYLILFLIFVISSWLFQRYSLKSAAKQKSTTIYHASITELLPVIVISILFLLIISFSTLKYNLIMVAFVISSFEIIQLFIYAWLVVVAFYPSIEKLLGIVVFGETILPTTNALNTRFAEKQITYSIKKLWKGVLILFGSLIFIANILVFLAYPSIPSTNYDASLPFFYPNINFQYNSTAGARQELIGSYELPTNVLLNWKLVQSLISIAYFAIFYIMYTQKNNENVKTQGDKNQSDEENSIESTITPHNNFEDSQEYMDNLVLFLLSPEEPKELYVPPTSLIINPPSTLEKVRDKAKGSIILPVLKLAIVNFAISYVIILIAQITGNLAVNDDLNPYFISFTQVIWAGYTEEFTFRLLMIGVPLFVIQGLAYLVRKVWLKSKKREKIYTEKKLRIINSEINPFRYLIGGWKQISVIDGLFILIAASLFGYAHYQFGWAAWKIFQTGIVGLIIGYAFCKYGIHVAIFLHVTMNFTSGLLIGVNLGWLTLGFVILLIFAISGGLYLFYLIAQASKVLLSFIIKLQGRGTYNELQR